MIADDDAGSFRRDVFESLDFVVEGKVFAGESEEVIGTACFLVFFNLGMRYVEDVETKEAFSQIE